MNLHEKLCTISKPETPVLSSTSKKELLTKLSSNWRLAENETKLTRSFKFSNFKKAMKLAVELGALADAQKHHPEFHIGWGHLDIEIWTHTHNDLVESDFILAAKFDQITEEN